METGLKVLLLRLDPAQRLCSGDDGDVLVGV
jgi:hypothetical protein